MNVKEYYLTKEMEEFDNAFEDGVFAIPSNFHRKVKVKKLADYCKSKGISPDEMTDKEMKQFLTE